MKKQNILKVKNILNALKEALGSIRTSSQAVFDVIPFDVRKNHT